MNGEDVIEMANADVIETEVIWEIITATPPGNCQILTLLSSIELWEFLSKMLVCLLSSLDVFTLDFNCKGLQRANKQCHVVLKILS